MTNEEYVCKIIRELVCTDIVSADDFWFYTCGIDDKPPFKRGDIVVNVLCNDVFAPAADLEVILPEEVDSFIEFVKQYEFPHREDYTKPETRPKEDIDRWHEMEFAATLFWVAWKRQARPWTTSDRRHPAVVAEYERLVPVDKGWNRDG